MTLRYSVLGSCVTRDIVDLADGPELPPPVEFFSRTKIESVVSAPTDIPNDVGLPSAFQARAVIRDHRKTALATLAASSDPLIIDLIDERFGLLDSGQGLVTDSLYWRQSRVSKSRTYGKVPNDQELAPEGPFATAAASLARALSQVPRVVIHRALWATRTIEGEELANAAEGERRNAWLRRAYDVLADSFPNSVCVEPAPDVIRADPGHRWGLAPFHYGVAYYSDVAAKIRAHLLT